MKVAYFINQYPGISHSFIRRELQALERNGVSVQRYAIRPSKDKVIAREDVEESAKTRHIVTQGKAALLTDMARGFFSSPVGAAGAFIKALKMGWRSEAGLLRHVLYFGEALVLASWLRRDDMDHVHAHFGTNATTIAMLAAPLAKASFSFTVHGPEEFEKPGLIALPEKIAAASFTAGISKFGASQLKKLSDPALWPNINIIRCGIERDFYADAERVELAKSDFVCVGRLCAEKGQIDLVEAVARVAKTRPDIKVTLIGDGPMRADIENRIAALGVERNVLLAGWKTPAEVREAILASRAFILPSYAEGLPVSIMEALILQRPVISTYIAGIPELVGHEECGWLTAAGDVDAIAEALLAALTASDDELARMGDEGRARVQAMHDIDKEASKLTACFSKVLERSA